MLRSITSMNLKNLVAFFFFGAVGCGTTVAPEGVARPTGATAASAASSAGATGGTSGSTAGTSGTSGSTGSIEPDAGPPPEPGELGGACNVFVAGAVVECREKLTCAMYAPGGPTCLPCGVSTDDGQPGYTCGRLDANGSGLSCAPGYTLMTGARTDPSEALHVSQWGCYPTAMLTTQGVVGGSCVYNADRSQGFCAAPGICAAGTCE